MKLQRFSQHDRMRTIIQILQVNTVGMAEPAISQMQQLYGANPFIILITCLLTLRTQDIVSFPVAKKLFQFAQTPQEMCALSDKIIENIVYPVGFYHQKTYQIKTISRQIVEQFSGVVPQSERALLSLSGVGPKTANLVLGQAFGISAICVDVHVHRISNRLGLVHTQTPEETEKALKKILPQKYWIPWNTLLVMWGQNVCTPRYPHCSSCAIVQFCDCVGVTGSY